MEMERGEEMKRVIVTKSYEKRVKILDIDGSTSHAKLFWMYSQAAAVNSDAGLREEKQVEERGRQKEAQEDVCPLR